MVGAGLMRVVMGGGMRYGLLLDRTGSKGKSKGKLVIFWAGRVPSLHDDPVDDGAIVGQGKSTDSPNPDVDPSDINLFDVNKMVANFKENSPEVEMSITPDNARIEGFLDIHLNLISPISVRKSQEQKLTSGSDCSFVYMNDMTKRLHIDSSTTSLDIITDLMDRYGVAEDPKMFALFECKGVRGGTGGRRLGDEEQPLLLALIWGPEPNRSLSLQEVPGGRRSSSLIQWTSFSLPELQNFAVMLEREENQHLDNIKARYEEKRKRLERRLQQIEQA